MYTSSGDQPTVTHLQPATATSYTSIDISVW